MRAPTVFKHICELPKHAAFLILNYMMAIHIRMEILFKFSIKFTIWISLKYTVLCHKDVAGAGLLKYYAHNKVDA